MQFNKTKLSVLIFALSIGLAGCVSDKNDSSPAPDPGTETPPDGSGDDPDDTPDQANTNLPLYEGVVLYSLKDLNIDTDPDTLRRVTRAVSGGTIAFTDQERSITGSSWLDLPAPALSSYVYAAETDTFHPFNGTSYAFEGDSNAYVYRIPDTDIKIDIDHFAFDATSQNVKDVASIVFGFANLPSHLEATVQFSGNEEIYMETQEFIDDAVIYMPGKKDDADACLMWDGSASNETVETTMNCNFVTYNGSGNGMIGGSLGPLANEDPSAAPVLTASSLLTSDFRLKADAGSTSQGDVIPGATEEVIGAWTMTTLNGRDAILVQLGDTELLAGYANPLPWQDPDAFYLVQDADKLRIAGVFLKETTLKTPNWLLGENGISAVENSLISPAP